MSRKNKQYQERRSARNEAISEIKNRPNTKIKKIRHITKTNTVDEISYRAA
jgi:hypothetical protein